MNNIENMLTPSEWYCEYKQDQIKLMREKIFNNLKSENKENNDKVQASKIIAEMKDDIDDQEEEDYILGLA